MDRLIEDYDESIRVNQVWTERLRSYLQLARLASRIDQPGFDVLGSRDADREEARMDLAFKAWREHYNTIRADLAVHALPAESGTILKELDESRDVVQAMREDARRLFSLTREGRWDQVALGWVDLQKRSDAVEQETMDVVAAVHHIQARRFADREKNAAFLERFATILGEILCVLILSAGFFGLRTYRLSVQFAALAESESRFRILADRAPVGICRTDPEGRCAYQNPRWEELTGEFPLGSSWMAFLHSSDRERIASAWETAKPGKNPFSFVEPGGPATGPERWLAGTIVPIPDGYLGTLVDMTEHKRVEKMQSQFITTISHELRTPLTALRGAVGMVAGGVTGPVPPQSKVLLDLAVKNCERLGAIVNDILDVQNLLSGKIVLRKEIVNVGMLLARAAEDYRAPAEALGVLIVLPPPGGEVLATGDPERLPQVFRQLLSNACKYSPRGQTVTFGLTRRAGRILVSISDRGPGIPEAFRSRLFQLFSQADNRDSSTTRGTGVGLAISKALVEGMGGTIGFTTKEGEGSTFTVELEERSSKG